MASAEVGDDVFGDDPTVNRLEAMAAERLGKEAAVYVPSGSMANLIAVMTHTRPGDEVVLGDQCHIMNYEVAGIARLANVLPRAVRNVTEDDPAGELPTGALPPRDVEAAFRFRGLHSAGTTLLCVENTHNRCGGAAIPLPEMDDLTSLAHRNGISVHLDGARIFNAAAALGTEASRIARDCDSVSFCLSKGLGCPVGSLVLGAKDYVAEARRNRKLLGGGMRQAGIIAAAGVYALEHNIDRLRDDHSKAAQLAEGIRSVEGMHPNRPQTNIVIIDVDRGNSDQWLAALRANGVLATNFGAKRLRMVTHLNIAPEDIDMALDRIRRTAEAIAG
jgi:threonine aldolase